MFSKFCNNFLNFCHNKSSILIFYRVGNFFRQINVFLAGSETYRGIFSDFFYNKWENLIQRSQPVSLDIHLALCRNEPQNHNNVVVNNFRKIVFVEYVRIICVFLISWFVTDMFKCEVIRFENPLFVCTENIIVYSGTEGLRSSMGGCKWNAKQASDSSVTSVHVVSAQEPFRPNSLSVSAKSFWPRKNNEAGNSLNAVEREPVPTSVFYPNASEASYKPKQRSYI